MHASEIELIAGQIASGYREGAWPGVSVRDVFHGMSAEEAAAHPIADAHSAWEIALHLGFWHDAARRRLAGDPVDYGPEEDWPAPPAPTDANWQKTLADVDRSLSDLIDAVRRLPPERLDDVVPGRKFSVYFMLHGIPQHDLYHAGQVVLLNKTLQRR
jgi:hypothetical protein